MRRKSRFITSPVSGEPKGSQESFISVVLFSENHGYRMKSYGPISLMKIEGKTLIQRQVDAIKATFKNFEIILCSGFETQKTVEFVKNNFADINIRVVENQMHFNSNCCESARLCLHNINNSRILLCNGALLLTPDMLSSIDYSQSGVLCQEKDEYKNFDVGLIENESVLQSMAVGVKTKLWNEVAYLCGRKIISNLYSTVSNPEYKNRFLFEAINVILKDNRVIVTDILNTSTVKIQNIKTLKRITRI
tara:strand:- start:11454 stop:12200 length:747 start_codon:yes stop_codon:yes gene_type:complete